MRRYQKTFTFFDTEEQARAFCDKQNVTASAYVRKKYKAHYTPWINKDRTENKFVAWYYI